MIKIIIPTKDRACQLDLLLRSIDKFWTFDGLQVNIIVAHSNMDFLNGYIKLFSNGYWDRYDIQVKSEEDFCEDVKSAIQYPFPSEAEYTGFMCDDCVLYRKLLICPNEIHELFTEDVLCFQTRLGINTYVQNYLTGETYNYIELKNHHRKGAGRWNYKTRPRYSNPGYLFSMDGAFYHTEWLWNAIKDRSFESPRALEHQLNTDDNLRNDSDKYMACENHSSLVVNTINAIQSGIPAGVHHSYSPEFLNDQYLAGNKISLTALVDRLGEVVGSHIEAPLEFI